MADEQNHLAPRSTKPCNTEYLPKHSRVQQCRPTFEQASPGLVANHQNRLRHERRKPCNTRHLPTYADPCAPRHPCRRSTHAAHTPRHPHKDPTTHTLFSLGLGQPRPRTNSERRQTALTPPRRIKCKTVQGACTELNPPPTPAAPPGGKNARGRLATGSHQSALAHPLAHVCSAGGAHAHAQ